MDKSQKHYAEKKKQIQKTTYCLISSIGNSRKDKIESLVLEMSSVVTWDGT